MRFLHFRNGISVLTIAFFLVLMLASCKPQPIVPSEEAPTEANYVICGADSLNIGMVVVMRSAYKSDVMDWSIKLSDTQILKFYTQHNLLEAGTYSFTTESDAYNGGVGVFGVYMEGFEEEKLTDGTIEVKLVLGKPEYFVNATTQSGRAVKMHYWGDIHDLTHPIGVGQFNYGDESLPLDIAYSQIYYDLYEYAFTDTVSGFGVTFYSVTPLTTGTFPISDDMDLVEQGQALNLYLYIEKGNTLLTGDVTNGAANCTLNGDQINISFNGELDGTAISGNYVGKLEHLGTGGL